MPTRFFTEEESLEFSAVLAALPPGGQATQTIGGRTLHLERGRGSLLGRITREAESGDPGAVVVEVYQAVEARDAEYPADLPFISNQASMLTRNSNDPDKLGMLWTTDDLSFGVQPPLAAQRPSSRALPDVWNEAVAHCEATGWVRVSRSVVPLLVQSTRWNRASMTRTLTMVGPIRWRTLMLIQEPTQQPDAARNR